MILELYNRSGVRYVPTCMLEGLILLVKISLSYEIFRYVFR